MWAQQKQVRSFEKHGKRAIVETENSLTAARFTKKRTNASVQNQYYTL